jgi:GR25 family glycosyltransferase involved in LPS biosynthesis
VGNPPHNQQSRGDFKMIETRIIAVDVAENSGLTEEQKVRYNKRNVYIQKEVIPKLLSLGITGKTFSAVTPNQIELETHIVRRSGDVLLRKHDWNTRNPINSYQACIFFSNFELWKESAKSDKPILIFEDDVLVHENMSNTVDCIQEYSERVNHKLEEVDQSILYLQSTCPWRRPPQLKTYSKEMIEKLGGTDSFFVVNKKCSDFSGAASYVVSPSGAKSLMAFAKLSGLYPLDQFFAIANQNNRIKIIIPKDYQTNFLLHPSYAFGDTE